MMVPVALLVRLPNLGSPVVPFGPFSFWAPLLKPNSRKKGTLTIKGLLGNLVTRPQAVLLLLLVSILAGVDAWAKPVMLCICDRATRAP